MVDEKQTKKKVAKKRVAKKKVAAKRAVRTVADVMGMIAEADQKARELILTYPHIASDAEATFSRSE